MGVAGDTQRSASRYPSETSDCGTMDDEFPKLGVDPIPLKSKRS